MANGTFDGLKNIKTIHLGKNPLICDCNLRWLADYLELNPIETSEARCEAPTRNQGKKISQLSKQKFECKGSEFGRSSLLANQCNAPPPPPPAPPSQQLLAIGAQQLGEQSCPRGCVCNGTSVDCLVSSQTESRTGGGLYELPEVADDVSVYVTRMRLNDNRIKKIRQTGIFQKLASSQKLDLGGSKIIDIEDNAINGPTSGLPSQSTKPERVIFVLLEKETHQCDLNAVPSAQGPLAGAPMEPKMPPSEDPCLAAAAGKTNAGPCQNGAACIRTSSSNFTCNCPTGFAGPLCETNIDDCLEHQCQNGAMCVDGLNSYRCVCRDPTTTGEFCEQLSNSFATSSANSISPIALPIVAPKGQGNLPSQVAQASNFEFQQQQQQQQAQSQRQPQSPQSILTRSADFYQIPTNELASSGCRKITERRYYEDGNGCQSIRMLKISECAGSCSESGNGCCLPAKIKRRKIRLQCNDGASYVKTIELVKKCACSDECNRINLVSNQRNQNQSNNRKQNEPTPPMNHRFNSTHDQDQLLQITRLDAVD